MTSEDRFLARLFARLPLPGNDTLVGPGDDAAVLVPANGALVATTDALVEGVHFDRAFCLPEEIGARSIQINLSDLAAQGAKPKYILISLIVPPSVTQDDLLRFNDGVIAVLSAAGAELVGGNVSKTSGPFVVSVTALGEPFPGVSPYQTPKRGTARDGDWIALTGPLGLAAVGLQALNLFGRTQAQSLFPRSVQRYLIPQARLHASERLLQTRAVTSMMDISDGLSLDLMRLRGSTQLDFILNQEALRPHPEISEFLQKTHKRSLIYSALDLMLNYGDDYELVLTLNPESWMRAVAENLDLKDLVHIIGEVEESDATPAPTGISGLWLRDKDNALASLQPQGWDHLPA